MSSDRHATLRRLFAQALELDPEARSQFIEQSCGEDHGLRDDLESLLAAAETPASESDLLSDDHIAQVRSGLNRAFEGAALPHASLVTRAEFARTDGELLGADPEAIGRYRIIRRIASGGMGTVWQAEQDSPKRIVALKTLHLHRSTGALSARLQREWEILGRLQHPGIAQVYDAGLVDMGEGGQPFFAMEFIDGQPLTKYADVQDLDDRQRLELLALACDAVHYAHERGIVHRDLKPDNIMVDGHGRPKVLDFGIARIASESVHDFTTMTRDGQILGTLSYMAPEQMDGNPDGVSARSDVYALGVVGFELLAGRLPHDVTSMSIAGALKVLTSHEPPKMESVDARFRGDVQTIIGTALEREPDRRYASAAALAADIRRHLAHEPIRARPPSAAYRARKFARRNRALVAGTTATMLVLVAGIIVALILADQERRQRERADESALAAREGEARVVSTVMGTAARALEAGNIWDAYDQHRAVPEQSRGWGWRLMSHALPDVRPDLATPAEGEGHLTMLPTWRFLGDDHLLAVDPDTGCLHVRALHAPMHERTMFCELGLERAGHVTSSGLAAAWSEDEVFVLDLNAKTVRARWRVDGAVSEATISDDGRLASARTGQSESHVWRDGQRIHTFQRSPGLHNRLPHCVVAPGGDHVFVHSPEHVDLVDVVSGASYRLYPRAPMDRIAVQPVEDGWVTHEWLTSDPRLSRLQLHSGASMDEPVDTLRLPARDPNFRCSRDGRLAAVVGRGRVHLVDVESNRPVRRSRWQREDGSFDAGNPYTTHPVLSPFASHLLLLTHVRGPWVIDLGEHEPPDADPRRSVYRGHGRDLYHLAVSNDGSMIASACPRERDIHVWDPATRELMVKIERDAIDFVTQDALMAFTPDDHHLVFTSPMDGRREVAVVRYEISTGVTELFWPEAPVATANHAPLLDLFIEHADPAPRQRLSLKAQMLDQRAITLWRDYRTDFGWPDEDVERSGTRWRTLPQPGREPTHDVISLSVHPTTDVVATVGPFTLTPGAPSPDGLLSIRDVHTGELKAEVELPRAPRCVAYSPDGSMLAVGCDDGHVLILETEFYTTTLDFRAHPNRIFVLLWMRDGHRLVTGSGDSTVRIWDDRGNDP